MVFFRIFAQKNVMSEENYQSSPIILRDIEYKRRTVAISEPITNYQCAPRAHHNSIKAQYSNRMYFAVLMYRELLKGSVNRFEAATEAATAYDVNYDKLMRIARKDI
jgi:hypothetical protein